MQTANSFVCHNCRDCVRSCHSVLTMSSPIRWPWALSHCLSRNPLAGFHLAGACHDADPISCPNSPEGLPRPHSPQGERCQAVPGWCPCRGGKPTSQVGNPWDAGFWRATPSQLRRGMAPLAAKRGAESLNLPPLPVQRWRSCGLCNQRTIKILPLFPRLIDLSQ